MNGVQQDDKFVSDGSEMVVDGKIFVDGEWVPVEEYRRRKQRERQQQTT